MQLKVKVKVILLISSGGGGGRGGKGIALPVLEPGARKWWEVSTIPRSYYPEKNP